VDRSAASTVAKEFRQTRSWGRRSPISVVLQSLGLPLIVSAKILRVTAEKIAVVSVFFDIITTTEIESVDLELVQPRKQWKFIGCQTWQNISHFSTPKVSSCAVGHSIVSNGSTERKVFHFPERGMARYSTAAFAIVHQAKVSGFREMHNISLTLKGNVHQRSNILRKRHCETSTRSLLAIHPSPCLITESDTDPPNRKERRR
jgi:hypothetical protein